MIHSTQELLSQHECNDLRWYLERAEGEISGMRSPPLVRQALKPGMLAETRAFYASLRQGPIHVGTQDHGAGAADIGESRIEAVRRERRVRQSMAGMDHADRHVLLACFAIDLLDAREVFGRYGNVADRTDAARAAHSASRSPLLLSAWLDLVARRLRNGSASRAGFSAHLRIMTESRELARSVAAAYSRGSFLAAA
jgi:hypothetical protein